MFRLVGGNGKFYSFPKQLARLHFSKRSETFHRAIFPPLLFNFAYFFGNSQCKKGEERNLI